MINDSVASDAFVPLDLGRLSRRLLVAALPSAVALVLSALAAAWMLHRLPVPVTPEFVQARAQAAAPARAPAVVAIAEGLRFDPGYAKGSAPFSPAPGALAEASALPAPPALLAAIPALEAPLPTPAPSPPPSAAAPSPPVRAAEAAPASPPPPVRRLAASAASAVPPASTPDARAVEKLFGGAKASGPALGYASAESGLLDGAASLAARYDRFTAVYDLAAHTVYLPDGTRLEAHSGLGNRRDDPTHVNERNRGATPPHVYELAALGEPFHGVWALRLNPVGGGDIFGRDGLLAHTYMLGPRGDSNGCVVFKNYNAFLQAFHTGQVKRLAVVARL